ncbi:MAG: hypothetical protein ABIQ60_04935 [Burkholderiaceae bacterium]
MPTHPLRAAGLAVAMLPGFGAAARSPLQALALATERSEAPVPGRHHFRTTRDSMP